MLFQAVTIALFACGVNVKFPEIGIPKDVRTAYKKHFVEPQLERYMCCPKCFSLYPTNPFPGQFVRCMWKASPQSKPCNTELWRRKRTRYRIRMVPKCLYTTQPFDQWLQFFLSRKKIDDALRATHERITENPMVHGAEMRDVQDSPGFRNLFGGVQSPYNLGFGLYVDWFNLHKMKIAGMFLPSSSDIVYKSPCQGSSPHLASSRSSA